MVNEVEFLSSSCPLEKRLNRFKEIINDSKNIVFFGGAGVSTGSGIPDFRSPGGLYNNVPDEFKNYQPEYLLSHSCYIEKPEVFFSFYRKYMDARNYEPNNVHKYLASLEQNEKLLGIVTQNIDTLHEKAGSKKLYKIHGTITSNHCIKCNKEYDINYVFDSKTIIPRCSCGGQVKPDVVLYEENLPSDAWNNAVEIIGKADCLIVCGTSLKVNPAASLVSMFFGKYLIIVNNEGTPYDNWADVVFHEDMNNIFEKLI